MDVNEDPDELSKTMREQLKELEKEKALAPARNEDTVFIDMQIAELHAFVKELEEVLDKATERNGTKRDQVKADKKGTTGTKGAFVSDAGQTFRDWTNENQEFEAVIICCSQKELS